MSHSDLVEYLIIIIFSVFVSVFLIMLGGGRFIKGRISHLFLCVCFWGRGYSDGFCQKFAFCDAIERALNANLIF